ncbi:MAG: malate dehydrogenase [Dehalococcoidia bacterium SM23_28_1]|nr:MAG: malate dehydrogenase [Dehalococcoidia bacterium SM23_28_1]
MPVRGHSVLLRIKSKNVPGMLAKVAAAIGNAGGNIGAIDTPAITTAVITRDITISVLDDEHGRRVVEAIKQIPDVKVVDVSNPILLAHLGGKIEIAGKRPVKTRRDLSMFYTPGVAEVSMRIHDQPRRAYSFTMKGNTVAVVTDGSAVLGLGDIGPEAALPVMEGKALLFKEFGGVDAVPICLDTKDPEEIIRTVKHIAPAFGGINLEDISAPRCFEIEERLRAELDIPVFHDDQHGTAVVVMAALINALKIVGKKLEDMKIVFSGVGAAGTATTKFLLYAGVRNIIGCDMVGALYRGRKEHMDPIMEWYAENTNPDRLRGTLVDVLRGADVFIGLSVPGVLPGAAIARMARDPIVFAMANPVPEVMPEEAAPYARIIATGRSDYPNQINNVLCFPGLFRGVLDSGAREINEDMKLAVAQAIAGMVSARHLHEDYIIPSVFDRRVVRNVAKAVARAAQRTGVARRDHRATHPRLAGSTSRPRAL